MENIRAFFNMVEEYLTHYKEIIEYKSDFYKYTGLNTKCGMNEM